MNEEIEIRKSIMRDILIALKEFDDCKYESLEVFKKTFENEDYMEFARCLKVGSPVVETDAVAVTFKSTDFGKEITETLRKMTVNNAKVHYLLASYVLRVIGKEVENQSIMIYLDALQQASNSSDLTVDSYILLKTIIGHIDEIQNDKGSAIISGAYEALKKHPIYQIN